MTAANRYLVLENGSVFAGQAFGSPVSTCAGGEIVFSTNMTGFTETVSDPSHCGQIVVQTFPLVGNYGVNPADVQATPKCAGYVVSQLCQTPSHFQSQGTFDAFFVQHGIPGLAGVDTRALTKMIRNAGQLRGVLADNPADAMFRATIDDFIAQVTVSEPKLAPADAAKHNVVLWDFGVKASELRELNARGCNVTVMPASSTAEQMLAQQPQGVLLSAGPGNPAQYAAIAEEIAKVAKTGVPVFAWGMGHQLLAMACGGKTERLPYGHRGGYSVFDHAANKTVIYHQNHGYAVAMNGLPANAVASHTNVNDKTCAGLDYTGINAFSVQFEPAAAQFDRFVSMMGGK
ncbi:MAG: carbamoyl phosphate synthase small subunit [Oscillospiraceae bacterium]|nr:carbamoyl phosphate synthase small subunit [Oscillospiraceae bacterium]